MANMKLNEQFVNRFKSFLDSDAYNNMPSYSKSEYWRDHSKAVKVNVSNDNVAVSGKSGFYVPPKRKSFINKVLKKLKAPSSIKPYIKKKLGIPERHRRFMDFGEAFDLVMKADPIACIDISPYRINFSQLANKTGIYKNLASVKSDYQSFFKNEASSFVIKGYFYLNILQGYNVLNQQTRRILEIGGGNGNFISLIKKHYPKTTIFDVDLSETLSHAIPFIAESFPEARILMPHELETNLAHLDEYDFVFLTPGQIHLIPEKHFDLAMNTHSFQEMTMQQIQEYFSLIYRSLKTDGYMYIINRVEKIPGGDDIATTGSKEPPIRFFEYPWKNDSEILIYEICKFMRLIYPDDCYIRLDKIK